MKKKKEKEDFGKNQNNIKEIRDIKIIDDDINLSPIKGKNYKKTKFNHSTDVKLRKNNTSNKKHLKIKHGHTSSSKTNKSSDKSDEKLNSSASHTKKMKIKSIVVNPTEYFKYKPLNKSYSISFSRGWSLSRAYAVRS